MLLKFWKKLGSFWTLAHKMETKKARDSKFVGMKMSRFQE